MACFAQPRKRRLTVPLCGIRNPGAFPRLRNLGLLSQWDRVGGLPGHGVALPLGPRGTNYRRDVWFWRAFWRVWRSCHESNAVLLGLASVPLLIARDVRTTFLRIGVFSGTALAVGGIGLYASGFDVAYVLRTTHAVLGDSGPAPAAESLVMQLANNETCTSCVAFFPLLTAFLMVISSMLPVSAKTVANDCGRYRGSGAAAVRVRQPDPP